MTVNDNHAHSKAMHEVAPFAAWMGLETESAANGRAVLCRLQPRPEMLNRRDVVHGGVLASILDSAMARASRTLDGVQELGGTIDLHVQFMQPAVGPLRVQAWVEHTATTIAFCRAEVLDAEGRKIAAGSASLRLRR